MFLFLIIIITGCKVAINNFHKKVFCDKNAKIV
jgi:hypothetical protein